MVSFNFPKKPVSGIKGIPKQTQKLVTQEPIEFLKTAPNLVLPEKTATGSGLQDMLKGCSNPNVTAEEIAQKQAQDRRRIGELREELEKEIQRVRVERQRREEEYSRAVEARFQPPEDKNIPKPFPQISSVPKRGLGPFSVIQRKQGTREKGKTLGG